ncbi:MAG TPA: cytochrome c [Verrucomicrobiae bacterium]|nr:cytochrome c [Verrucomicrobiae bacterium]
MRYFFAAFILLCLVVVGVAGFRGDKSRRPPIEVFPDMDRQPKLRPETQSSFFADGMSSRLQVPGTVARGQAYEDSVFNTGHVPGSTNFVETLPVAVNSTLLARGQQRFNIYCSPCHGAQGDAKGITTKFGMAIIANLHDKRIVQMADGEIFNTISNGKNNMGSYAPQIEIPDRWAVIAYLRALQRSRLATLDDVPQGVRASLKK